MFYLIKFTEDSPFDILELNNTTDATYNKIGREAHEMGGQFGRRDYAEIWKDFHNGQINRKQLQNRLGL